MLWFNPVRQLSTTQPLILSKRDEGENQKGKNMRTSFTVYYVKQ